MICPITMSIYAGSQQSSTVNTLYHSPELLFGRYIFI